MTTNTENVTTTQVYLVYIKATAEAIWTPSPSPSGPDATATPVWPPTTCARAAPTRCAREQFKAEGAAQGYQIPDVIIDGEVR
jgi:hypothetical protein